MATNTDDSSQTGGRVLRNYPRGKTSWHPGRSSVPPVIRLINTLNFASHTLRQGDEESTHTTIIPITTDPATEPPSHDTEDAVQQRNVDPDEPTAVADADPNNSAPDANNIPQTEIDTNPHDDAVGNATETLSQFKHSILHRHSRVLRAEHHKLFLGDCLKKKVCPVGLRLDKRINVMDSANHDRLQKDIATYFDIANRGLLEILVSYYESMVQLETAKAISDVPEDATEELADELMLHMDRLQQKLLATRERKMQKLLHPPPPKARPAAPPPRQDPAAIPNTRSVTHPRKTTNNNKKTARQPWRKQAKRSRSDNHPTSTSTWTGAAGVAPTLQPPGKPPAAPTVMSSTTLPTTIPSCPPAPPTRSNPDPPHHLAVRQHPIPAAYPFQRRVDVIPNTTHQLYPYTSYPGLGHPYVQPPTSFPYLPSMPLPPQLPPLMRPPSYPPMFNCGPPAQYWVSH